MTLQRARHHRDSTGWRAPDRQLAPSRNDALTADDVDDRVGDRRVEPGRVDRLPGERRAQQRGDALDARERLPTWVVRVRFVLVFTRRAPPYGGVFSRPTSGRLEGDQEMKTSDRRILTTHAGSLPRTDTLARL